MMDTLNNNNKKNVPYLSFSNSIHRTEINLSNANIIYLIIVMSGVHYHKDHYRYSIHFQK